MPEVSLPSGRPTATAPRVTAAGWAARAEAAFHSGVLGQLVIFSLRGSDLVQTPIGRIVTRRHFPAREHAWAGLLVTPRLRCGEHWARAKCRYVSLEPAHGSRAV